MNIFHCLRFIMGEHLFAHYFFWLHINPICLPTCCLFLSHFLQCHRTVAHCNPHSAELHCGCKELRQPTKQKGAALQPPPPFRLCQKINNPKLLNITPSYNPMRSAPPPQGSLFTYACRRQGIPLCSNPGFGQLRLQAPLLRA